MGLRTLPIRVAPLPGEALESWLAAVAQRLNASWGDLLTAIAPPSDPASLRRPHLTAYLGADESAAIAAATGVWQASVEALTLSRYDGHLLVVDPSTGRVRSPWISARSRFCPLCLHASGGRWQLAWRLPWVFACAEHACTLADTCPTCGQFQRVNPWWLSSAEVPELVRCSRKIEVNGARRRCEGNLLAARTTALTPDHPLATTQTRLSRALSTTSATFGVYQVMPTSSLQVLKDLQVLAARILAMADVENVHALLGCCGPNSVTRPWAELDLSFRGFAGPKGFATTAHSLTTGLGIALALSVLSCATLEEAADRLRPVFRSGRASGQEITATTLRHGALSAALNAVNIKALADSLSPHNQLRYRTNTPLPRYPSKLTVEAIRCTPTCLWRDWSFRFMVGRSRLEVIRPGLSLMLLSAGNRITAATAARRLGSPVTDEKYSRILAGLCTNALWPNIATAIIRLADYLADNPSPIDYQRRRHLDYRDLLTAAQWDEIYDPRYLGAFSSSRAGELVRGWLFQRISMQPAKMSPFAAHIYHADWRRAEVVTRFTPTMVRKLDDAAADFLHRHGAIGEPATWSPPLSIIADLELPGPDPDSVSTPQLHDAIDNTTSMAAAARHLRLPTSAAYFLLERSPLARPIVPRPSQTDYAITRLSKREFIRLHHRDQVSITAIAARVGVQPRAISNLARQYGVEIRGSSPNRRPVDPNWIYREYVVQQRTLSDMAREIGMDVASLSRNTKKHGIKVWRDPRTRTRAEVT